jgi:hypothetical protein
MRASGAKTAFAVAKSIWWMVCGRPNRQGMCVLLTLTFAENITERADREIRWRRLKARMLRRWPGLEGVGAWQRQKRGAWHAHVVVNQFLPVAELRAMCLACGFGSFCNLVPVEEMPGYRGVPGGTREQQVYRCAKYITRYLVRDVGQESGERTAIYFGEGARSCTVRFSWANGKARLWRMGAKEFFEVFGESPSWNNRELVMQLGWAFATTEERSELYCGSTAVAEWVDAPYVDAPF